MTSDGTNMKGTIYGNRLPRGTQVKKAGNHYSILREQEGRWAPVPVPTLLIIHNLRVLGLESQHTRTEPTAKSLVPDMSYRLETDMPAYVLNLHGQKIIPITGLVHPTMDCPMHSYYLLQLNLLSTSEYQNSTLALPA
jgi:hypothetical protein